eukprot:5007241-Prymnesium_polylepis.1
MKLPLGKQLWAVGCANGWVDMEATLAIGSSVPVKANGNGTSDRQSGPTLMPRQLQSIPSPLVCCAETCSYASDG